MNEELQASLALAIKQAKEKIQSPHFRDFARVEAMKMYIQFEEMVKAGFTQMQALYIISERSSKD